MNKIIVITQTKLCTMGYSQAVRQRVLVPLSLVRIQLAQ